MDKNTVYILQKDLPHVKAGTEFSQENNNPDYYNANFCHYHDRLHKSRIINNPTWFKPKEEVNESKPTEQFQWTNELVMEFVNFHDEQKGIHWLSEDIEKFKQSKSKTEQPLWEILEFEHSSGKATFVLNEDKKYFCQDFKDEYFNLEDLLHNKLGKTYNIKKVKRLSDGEVFSVGDYVEYAFVGASDNFYTPHLIKRFEIKDGVMNVQGEVPELFNFTLISCKKSKAPKEEQVPIKVKSIAFYTSMREMPICDVFSVRLTGDISEDKLQSIKSAIEDVLNGKTEYGLLVATGNIESFNKGYSMGYKDANKYNDKKYTESELLQARRDAFDAARLTHPMVGTKYDTFEDYINSLK